MHINYVLTAIILLCCINGGITGPQEGDYSWSEGKGMEARGHISERDGTLVLEGYIGNRRISANLRPTEDALHIFTLVRNLGLSLKS